MRRLCLLIVCAALAQPVHAIGAQTNADSLTIELLAARAMLPHQSVKGALSIDPMVGTDGDAPSTPKLGELRAPNRTEALAKALSARVRSFGDLLDCTGQAPCAMSGSMAHLILSAPSIHGDSATVTATIHQNTSDARQPVDYETVLFTITRSGRGWIVASELQLGIS